MKTSIATLSDGKTIEYIDEIIGEGGEKIVYFTKDKKEVVCLYKDVDVERRSRLEAIIGQFNPTIAGAANAEYWKSLFCWPTAIVVKPNLGVVCPVYPANFFFPKHKDYNDFFGGGEKQGAWFVKATTRKLLRQYAPDQLGDFRTNLALVTRLARAVRRLHSAGLAHSDLSYKNVLIDPKTGAAVIIDIDSLVVRGFYPPTVLGTPGFIAPEVLKTQHLPLNDPKRHSPSISTDRHALASLIYQYLLLRDPLDGPKIHDSDAAKDEMLKMGEKALFIEHPVDKSNRPANMKPSINALGPYLVPLFNKTFIDGLHTPDERIPAGQWEEALVRTFNILVPCGNTSCEAKFYPCWSKEKAVCPFCGSKFGYSFPVLSLLRERKPGNWVPDCELACYVGIPIMSHHVFDNIQPGENRTSNDNQPFASVNFVNNQWMLVNTRLPSMLSSAGNRVQPGQATLLTHGARIQLSQEPNGRLAEVIMVTP